MSFLFVIIGLAVLVLIHELGHFLMAKRFGLLVEEFGFGFPPRLFAKKIGETLYSFNLLPIGGFVKIYGESGELLHNPRVFPREEKIADGRSFERQSAWKRVAIMLAGVFMNFLLGWLLLSVVFMIGVPRAVVITQVLENSPAAAAGFQLGDVVLGYEKPEDLISHVQANRGQELTLEIKRGKENLKISAVPKNGVTEGALGVALAGVGFEARSPWQALVSGLVSAFWIGVSVIVGFWNLITSLFIELKVPQGIVGPVGIFGVASQAGSLGVVYLLQLVAVISLNLAALNILPFPALDGGRIFLVLVEKIKGSPLKPQTEILINGVGFTFLLVLMAVITVKDIASLL